MGVVCGRVKWSWGRVRGTHRGTAGAERRAQEQQRWEGGGCSPLLVGEMQQAPRRQLSSPAAAPRPQRARRRRPSPSEHPAPSAAAPASASHTPSPHPVSWAPPPAVQAGPAPGCRPSEARHRALRQCRAAILAESPPRHSGFLPSHAPGQGQRPQACWALSPCQRQARSSPRWQP